VEWSEPKIRRTRRDGAGQARENDENAEAKVMTSIGPYEIVETLHTGERPLFKVKDHNGRVLALKAAAAAGLEAEMRERFLREMEICRTLDHPNLVRVYDAGEADGYLYQAMDLLEGSNLFSVFTSGRNLAWPQKLDIMEQISAGLEYAHARKLVHRDIKPANLFLENSGRVRVLDFGMARIDQSKLTRVGSTVGTVTYMSPEQVRGESCTAASDVFSAGIVFFQLATGRHPFASSGASISQLVSAVVFENQPKLSEFLPDPPNGLESVLNKALAKNPADRPQDGGGLKRAVIFCRAIQDVPGAPATRPAASPKPEAPPKPSAPPQPAATPSSPPADAAEGIKTIMVERSTFTSSGHPGPAAPSPVAPPPALLQSPPITGQVHLQKRFCPSCTFANELTAKVCVNCGFPIVGQTAEAPRERSGRRTLYIAIAVAALLAVAVIVLWITKSR
jgi:serine/threonine protein kinase